MWWRARPEAGGTGTSPADFAAMAEAAFAALPEAFRAQCGRLVIRVAETAPREVLDELDLDDPLELTGLYQGVPLTEKSYDQMAALPDEVWLYRQAILAEHADRGDVDLRDLVAHVLVHEIAHHFGMSDEDIAEIDEWWL